MRRSFQAEGRAYAKALGHSAAGSLLQNEGEHGGKEQRGQDLGGARGRACLGQISAGERRQAGGVKAGHQERSLQGPPHRHPRTSDFRRPWPETGEREELQSCLNPVLLS